MSESEIDMAMAITLAEAAALMRGRGGKAPTVETVRRWANPNEGLKIRGKTVAILCSVRISGERLTTEEWVRAFERRRLELGSKVEAPKMRSPAKRAAGHRRATERLRKDGVGTAMAPAE